MIKCIRKVNRVNEASYATKKAGIIKENSSTVFFEQTLEVNQVFINECKNKINIVVSDYVTGFFV